MVEGRTFIIQINSDEEKSKTRLYHIKTKIKLAIEEFKNRKR
jgi:hypothetical protein